jgi:hypothetical protein
MGRRKLDIGAGFCVRVQVFAFVACNRAIPGGGVSVAPIQCVNGPMPAVSDGGLFCAWRDIERDAYPGKEALEHNLERATTMEKNGMHDQALAEARVAAAGGLGEAWYWIGMNTVGSDTEALVKAAERGYPPAFNDALDALLFRASAKADVKRAKRVADLARCLHVNLGYDQGELLRTVDRCYGAGEPPLAPALTNEERSLYSRPQFDCAPYRAGPRPATDASKYLHCLWAQPQVDMNAVAEVYANAWGVPRDITVAISLVCHGSDVPAELTSAVADLWESKDLPPRKEFRFCDYVTSGLNMGQCAAEVEARASSTREQALATLSAHWTSPQKRALAALSKAAEAFFSAHALKEVDNSGSWRAAMRIGEEENLRDRLLSQLQQVESGKVPADATFRSADRRLNEVYARVLKQLSGDGSQDDYGTIGETGVRMAEKKWLAYRDAWAVLGMARWPDTRREQWLTWITAERVDQLKGMIGNDSP